MAMKYPELLTYEKVNQGKTMDFSKKDLPKPQGKYILWLLFSNSKKKLTKGKADIVKALSFSYVPSKIEIIRFKMQYEENNFRYWKAYLEKGKR